MWHFRRGGVPQLRQWTARKLGAEYAINYARLLDTNQRQLQNELDSFKEKYDNDFSAVKSSQEQVVASIREEYQEKFDDIAAKHEASTTRSKELQEEMLASFNTGYQSELCEVKKDYEGLIGRLEEHQQTITEQHAVIEELQTSSKNIARDYETLTKKNRRLRAIVFSNASRTGLNPELELEDSAFRPLVQELVEQEHTLPLLKLAENLAALRTLNLTELRRLGQVLNAAGYWSLLAGVQELIFAKSKKDTDKRALERTLSTMAAFRAPVQKANQQSSVAYNPSGPVIHVVGKGLLDAQTGYTLRTSYTVRAQQQQGIPTLVVLQPGSSKVVDSAMKRISFENVQYVRLPGKPRGRSLLSQWLVEYISELEKFVLDEKPSVLHAHSDFLNGAAAVVVGRRNGIPVIYESRGFWEESWMSRLGDKLGLGLEPAKTLEQFGLPEAYTLRQQAEYLVRAGADAVITLADVMKDHIAQEHEVGGLGPVHIVPNAVEPNEFEPRPADSDLASTLDIPDGAVTIGYVTSMVEYEGIDVLLKAFARLQNRAPELETRLLLVGDGPVLDRLKRLAEDLGVAQRVIFTGRVPHEEVGRYYSLIDIFVIPRRPTTVSQLVTPLKPFEAMSMAKAVVVSGVRALEEIATESGAAYSFIPNDHVDLARVLCELVLNNRLRGELGHRARSWVAEHRSWVVNAQKTLEIYRSLGSDWPQITGGSDTDWTEKISEHLQQVPPPKTGWFVLGVPKDTVHTIMTEGWQFEKYPRIRLDREVDWESIPAMNRSLALWLQSWYFVDAFFLNERQIDLRETQFLLQAIRQWNAARLERAAASDSDESMAYYDMALALRAPRLVAVVWLASQFEETRHELDWLVNLLLHERHKLCESEAFNPRTNHGFYTAAAQLHLEKFLPELPDHKPVQTQASERMSLLVRSQFSEDGGHLEHSPSYHRLLLEAFMSAVDHGLIVDQDMVDRLRRAQKVMGWMIQPNGEILAMGDTEAAMTPSGSAMRDSSTRWIRTDGKSGEPETSEMLVLPESGYVFVRSPQPAHPNERLSSSYLAFQAGFHSRTHKHADDLSFVWFDRGQEILIDAGRWGYGPLLPADSPLREEGFYYSAPERQYVEAVRAHNTLELDGKIHDRRREPYGSAITEAQSFDGRFVIEGKVSHVGYVHDRKITLRPHQRLVIHDKVESTSRTSHHATVWFLLNGSSELLEHGDNEVTFRLENGDLLVIQSTATINPPVKGQEDPLTGWRSKKFHGLVPAWSISAQTGFVESAYVETEFRIVD